MNEQLQQLLSKADAQLFFDGENACIAGPVNGSGPGWETEDVPCTSQEEAEAWAAEHLTGSLQQEEWEQYL